jgi:hypothetical protein
VVSDDATLTRLVVDSLAAVDLPPVRLGRVQTHRLPHVYPVFERGYASRLAALEAWAGQLPSVTTLGRSGLFAHDNTHHAMVMAYDAADCLGPGEPGTPRGGQRLASGSGPTSSRTSRPGPASARRSRPTRAPASASAPRG